MTNDERDVSLSSDPVLWSADQVIHWAVWVMKEFNIDEMEIGSIHIPGRELCSFSQEEFLQKVPNGEILWSHLELLRKCKSDRVVALKVHYVTFLLACKQTDRALDTETVVCGS